MSLEQIFSIDICVSIQYCSRKAYYYSDDQHFMRLRDDCGLQDEWVPQENMDEEMVSAESSDDDSEDDKDVVGSKRRPTTERGNTSTETAMERDVQSEEDNND